MEKWSKERAWVWYNAQPWIRGCNFIGSDCANRRDMWQSYKSEEHLKTAERELALCEKIGFNTVRMLLDFDVYFQEPASFMEILERYMEICARHHIRVMLTLANDVELPRGMDEPFVPKPLGEQAYWLGYHQGRRPLAEEEKAKEPYHYLEREETREAFLNMVKEVVGRYRNDERVLCWNIYNEPGISIGNRVTGLLKLLFETVRALEPIQPLTSDIWYWKTDHGRLIKEYDKCSLELSDVISFHYYGNFTETVEFVKAMKGFGRPLFCTEWLNRIKHSDVKEVYPLFYLEKIACYCWGFVVGKTQTNEPWDDLWVQYDASGGKADYDFTKWQHDLFRPSLRPYDPHEVEVITHFNALADEDMRRE